MIAEALFFSAILFTIGVVGVLTRRNALILFMCVELMLNAVNLSFVALSKLHGGTLGQVFAAKGNNGGPVLLQSGDAVAAVGIQDGLPGFFCKTGCQNAIARSRMAAALQMAERA